MKYFNKDIFIDSLNDLAFVLCSIILIFLIMLAISILISMI